MARTAAQRRGGTALVAALVALALVPTAGNAAAGDVYVADEEANAGGGAVLRLGPSGGAVTGTFASALFFNPSGLAFDARGRLIVADYTANALDIVLPATGAVSTLSGPPTVGAPQDVALGPDRQLYAIDRNAPAIVRVDPNTGAAALVASASGAWDSAGGIVVARDRTIYFTDQDDEVFRVAPGASTATVFAENPDLQGAEGILLSPDERFLFVAAASGGTQHIVRVDVGSAGVQNFAAVDALNSMTMLPTGGFLITNPSGGAQIESVSPDGLTVTDFSTDAAFEFPHDIVVQPAKCGGKFPTVVGTTAADVLRGSRFADVISPLGGNDVVRGLAGKDVICGGKGRDRLLGGGANDRLLGGAGRDRLIGGKGSRDKLRGGPGRDRVRQ